MTTNPFCVSDIVFFGESLPSKFIMHIKVTAGS